MKKATIIEFSEQEEQEILESFPIVDCPITPLGNRILVQIRRAKNKTKSGLVITSDSQEDIYRNEQTAVVLKIGASAFTFPTTGERWPSGEWFKIGDFVRVPLHGGDNHWIVDKNVGDGEKILFKTFKDYEIIGLIEGNPMDVKTNMAYF